MPRIEDWLNKLWFIYYYAGTKNRYKQTVVMTLENAHTHTHTHNITQHLKYIVYICTHKDEEKSQVCKSDYFWVEEIRYCGGLFFSLHFVIIFL